MKYLDINYRCHTRLVKFLSATIYEYCITAGIRAIGHPAARKYPCAFYISDIESQESDMRNLMATEADAVLKQVQHYFGRWPREWKNITYEEACIISPFRGQVRKYRNLQISLVPFTAECYQVQNKCT